MARYDRMTVLNAMYDIGLVPVFYHADVKTVIGVIEACAAGGARGSQPRAVSTLCALGGAGVGQRLSKFAKY